MIPEPHSADRRIPAPMILLSRKRRMPAKNLTFERNSSQLNSRPVLLRFANLVSQTINH
jgi:hypothetical protein